MSSVVRNENLLAVVHHHAVGELQVLGAAKLVQDVAHLIKYNHTHDLKNYHLNGKKIVRCQTGAVFCPILRRLDNIQNAVAILKIFTESEN